MEKQPGFDPARGILNPSVQHNIAAYWNKNPFGDTEIDNSLCFEDADPEEMTVEGPKNNPELELNETGKHLANLQDAAYHYYRLQIKRVIDSEPLKEYEKLFHSSKIHKGQEHKYKIGTRPKIKTLVARIKSVMPEANNLKEIYVMEKLLWWYGLQQKLAEYHGGTQNDCVLDLFLRTTVMETYSLPSVLVCEKMNTSVCPHESRDSVEGHSNENN